MNKIIILFFLILSATLSSRFGLAGNLAKEVALESQDGNRKLIYKCDEFRHQVKQGEDLRILMPYISSTMKGLVMNNDVVTANALEIAFDREDVRRIERIVVEYLCGLK